MPDPVRPDPAAGGPEQGGPSRAERLLRARLAGDGESAPHGPAGPARLTATQEGLWFESRLDPAGLDHHRPTVYRLNGPLDVGALGQAIDQAVVRQAVLRTSYPLVGGRPMQLVHDPTAIGLAVVDLSGVDPTGRAAQARAIVTAAATRPFDVERVAPFDATLVRLEQDDHLLVLAVHHLAIDGPSADLLQRELAAGYERARSGSAASPGSPLPAPVPTFAGWADQQARSHRSERSRDEREARLAWWRQVLAGPLPTLPATPTPPTRRAEPNRELDLMEVVPAPLRPARVEVPDGLTDALHALARSEGVTRFAAFLAGLQLLVLDEWQVDDLVVGVPASDRHRHELDEVVGCFVSVLPVRLRIARADTGRALVARAGATMISALAHADVSMREIVAAAMPRDRDGQAASPVMSSAQLRPAQPPITTASGLRIDRVAVAVPGPGVNLLVTEGPTPTIELAIAPERGGPAEAGHLADALVDQLRRLVQVPDRPVREAAEGQAGAGERPSAYPPEVTIPELFARIEREGLERIAVVDGEESLTYRQLGDRARDRAAELAQLGVGPGHTVAIDLERSIDCVAAMLAVVLSGAAYVPLDPLSPPDRTRLVLDDAAVTATIGSAGTERVAADLRSGPLPLPIGGGTRAPAYVIYTSGSTGEPKGVVVHHGAVIHLVRTVDHVEFAPGVVIGFASSPAFDVATYEVWGALLNGATLVVVDRDTLLDPAVLEAFLAEHGITSMHLNTALVNSLVRQRPAIFAGLHELSFGGEAVEPRWIRALLEAGPPGKVVHDYGPTETTVSATRHLVTHVAEDAVTVPIGGPLGLTTLHVLDEDRRPVPAGVPGELWIGGPGVALGYLNQPELTAERFVPDPFDPGPDARVYRTGDLVVARPDGPIEFLGRVDTQVKVRGFRVELGEIENALARHPAVDLVAVHAWRRDDDTVLVAYVVPASGRRPELAELRNHLREIVPPYMVPSRLVLLAELPWTVSGKVDRAALPEPIWGTAGGSTVEQDDIGRMQRVWATSLDQQEVGADDDFFELGGHSLRAVALLAAVADEFGVELRIADLLAASTPRRLSLLVAPGPSGAGGSSGAPGTWAGWAEGVIELAEGEPGRGTVVLIPPNSGLQLLVDYRVLARHLGGGRRVITFTPQGLTGRDAPLDTVPALARHYRERLRAAVPGGPVVIGGHSLGGSVALEMARLIDGELTDGEPIDGEPIGGNGAVGPVVVESVVMFDTRRYDDPAARRRVRLKRPVRRARQAVRAQVLPAHRDGGSPEVIIGEAGAAARRAALTYQPRPYAGRVIYLAAQGTPDHPEQLRRDEGWTGLLTAIEVLEVPGRHSGHESMLTEPHVVTTAARLRLGLAGAGDADPIRDQAKIGPTAG